jgi:hypothetical protein
MPGLFLDVYRLDEWFAHWFSKATQVNLLVNASELRSRSRPGVGADRSGEAAQGC